MPAIRLVLGRCIDRPTAMFLDACRGVRYLLVVRQLPNTVCIGRKLLTTFVVIRKLSTRCGGKLFDLTSIAGGCHKALAPAAIPLLVSDERVIRAQHR